MGETESKPFICLDADAQSTLQSITKRIDEFFPDKIVRLKINGNYSPFFYMGKGKWIYKPKVTKTKQRFTFKLFTNDDISDFLNKEQIAKLEKLNIETKSLKVASDIYLIDQDFNGLFFTNGEHIVIDHVLIENANKLSTFFSEHLECKIVLDSLSEDNNGMIVLKTTNDIFGIKND